MSLCHPAMFLWAFVTYIIKILCHCVLNSTSVNLEKLQTESKHVAVILALRLLLTPLDTRQQTHARAEIIRPSLIRPIHFSAWPCRSSNLISRPLDFSKAFTFGPSTARWLFGRPISLNSHQLDFHYHFFQNQEFQTWPSAYATN